MTTQTMNQGALGERRYDLDWVRIAAFMLLIFYHVGMYYVTWDWHVKSPSASHALEPLMMLSSPWRLSLLFVISGVATGYLLERQGVRRFLGQRSVRLLVPLLFGMAVIVPPQSYLEVIEKVAYQGSYLDFLGLYLTAYGGFCKSGGCLILPTWNHLWFVMYLWSYTVVLYVGVRLAPRVVPALRRGGERLFGGAGAVIWPIAYLSLVGTTLSGRFPANHALAGDWYNHALYGAMFLLGFALAGTRAPWLAFERMRWPALGGAVLGWAFLCARMGVDASGGHQEPALTLLAGIVYNMVQWLPIVAILGFARRHLNQDSPARRYLTSSVFPVYILHQTVIVVCAHALKPSHLQPGSEGMLLVLVTGAASFLGYELIRRVRLLRPLFGLAAGAGDRARRDTRPCAPARMAVPQDIN
ncbi:MAG TPA: acyltransferase family protein [Steroidobacteraceae bacterium]